MTWFAFKGLNNGKAIDLAGTQEKQATVTGFHGYGTEKDAEANPNSINFLNRIEADGFIADYNAAIKQGSQPGGPNANITNPATAAKAAATGLVNSIPGVGSAITSVEGFVSAFGNRNLWIRVAKVIVGGAILIVGLLHLTGADKAIGGFAAKAVKVAPLL
jgi:hypothetical protein